MRTILNICKKTIDGDLKITETKKPSSLNLQENSVKFTNLDTCKLKYYSVKCLFMDAVGSVNVKVKF